MDFSPGSQVCCFQDCGEEVLAEGFLEESSLLHGIQETTDIRRGVLDQNKALPSESLPPTMPPTKMPVAGDKAFSKLAFWVTFQMQTTVIPSAFPPPHASLQSSFVAAVRPEGHTGAP